MTIKCCQCRKPIPDGSGKVITMDGDFVCNDTCHQAFRDEMGRVASMSDSEFFGWLGVTPTEED